jgi:GNAT superfamily N-acetyltransferase
MDAVIEPAGKGDLAAVLGLYAQLFERDPAPADAEAIWRRLLASEQTTVYVARVAGAAVGTCTLTIVPNLGRSGRPYALMENVVVDAGQRGTGVGRTLVKAVIAQALAADCYKVSLSTGRPETVGFYEACGFVRSGKTYFEVRAL